MPQECLRCSNTELEIVRYKGLNKGLHEYEVRCNHCGRVDPYFTEEQMPIAERANLRQEMLQGLPVFSNQINPGSDQQGAPQN